MTISIDSNVLVGLWDEAEQINFVAKQVLRELSTKHTLSVSGVVFAELMGGPGRNAQYLSEFFRKTNIAVDWSFGENICRLAGETYYEYCARRRTQRGELPRRILADFLIGAHASVAGHSLLTLDQRLYRAAFPKLHLVRA